MDIWIKDSKGKPLIGRVEICNLFINIRDTEFVDCFLKDSSNRFSMKLAGAPRCITMYNAILWIAKYLGLARKCSVSRFHKPKVI